MSVELSVILPTYNAAGHIGSSVNQLLAFLEEHGIAGEIIVVDDGSSDGTAGVVPVNDRVRVVRLEENRGKGAAIRAGMQQATGSIRAFTDADLPYGTDPFLLARRYIGERGFHAVAGDRTLPGSSYQHEGLLRRSVSAAAGLIFRTLVTGGIYDTQCGFKAFRGDVAAELFRISRIDGFAVDVELIYLLLKHRLDIKRVPVRLRFNAGSSVHVVRDSLRAGVDILSMRANWARGRYRSSALRAILATESQAPQ